MLGEVVMAVKMPPTCSRTERPYAPLLYAVDVVPALMPRCKWETVKLPFRG